MEEQVVEELLQAVLPNQEEVFYLQAYQQHHQMVSSEYVRNSNIFTVAGASTTGFSPINIQMVGKFSSGIGAGGGGGVLQPTQETEERAGGAVEEEEEEVALILMEEQVEPVVMVMLQYLR